MDKPAEKCRYWKTSRGSPDSWVEKTCRVIEQFGGDILQHAFGSDNGKAAYLIRFEINGERFRILWPVLESETDDTFSARRQAATMLYHDVKAKCVSAQVLGTRVAFFSWVELPDGRSLFQLGNDDIVKAAPKMLQHSKRD